MNKSCVLNKYGEALNVMYHLNSITNNLKPRNETSYQAIKEIKNKIKKIEKTMLREYDQIDNLLEQI
jgi:hypothetical protein